MVKIVILIGKPKSPLIYLVNAINEYHRIDLLIVEHSGSSKKKVQSGLLNKVRGFYSRNFGKHRNTTYSFIEKILRYLLFKLERVKKEKKDKKQDKENAVFFGNLFEGKHMAINKQIPLLNVNDINSKQVEDAIKKVNPTLLIDHGTKLLKNDIIELSDLALNLHWGLSPYYRGVDCTKRALFNWDVNNIGVTIHKLSKNIDGGDILGQARVKIEPKDNEDKITAKMTFLGTEILINTIKLLNNNKTLTFDKQEFTKGFLFKIKHMNLSLQTFTDNLNENDLGEIINNPSRSELPIITLNASE